MTFICVLYSFDSTNNYAVPVKAIFLMSIKSVGINLQTNLLNLLHYVSCYCYINVTFNFKTSEKASSFQLKAPDVPSTSNQSNMQNSSMSSIISM